MDDNVLITSNFDSNPNSEGSTPSPYKNSDLNNKNKRRLRLPFKVFGFFAFTLAILISGASVYLVGQGIMMKTISKFGMLDAGRKLGFIKTNEGEFFNALDNQDLAYDFNNDGTVTGEDYREMLKKQVAETSTTTTTPDGTTSYTTGGDNIGLPSVRGFANSEFDGSSTINYPLDLPTGPAGLKPSLSLNYSSSSVDDLQVGTYVGNAVNYENASGSVGLGWNLGGIGSITAEREGEPSYNINYVLSFEKGSANLIKESGDDIYSVWRTVPNLKIRVERFGKCIADDAALFTHEARCRFSWVVSDDSNNRFYFGSPNLVPKAQWAFAKDPDKDANVDYWYPLYDGNDNTPSGTRMWYTYTGFNRNVIWNRAIVYKYLLSKVVSSHDKSVSDAEINYNYDLEVTTSATQITSRVYAESFYSVASYPKNITWGSNEITFEKENRYDIKYSQKSWSGNVHTYPDTGTKRIKKIVVKTLNKVRAAYVLDYVYGWKPSENTVVANNLDCQIDASTGSITGSEKDNKKPAHSLLTKITQYADDPAINASAAKLPSNSFSYGANCNGFCGGCPLTAFYEDTGGLQIQSANYFFLQSADNGYGGKTTFEYWKNSSNQNALPTKICDDDKLDSAGASCKTDILMSTGRHRIASSTTYDGMGNFYKSSYNYSGTGATTGLAYASQYFKDWCGDGNGPTGCTANTTMDRLNKKCNYNGTVLSCKPEPCNPDEPWTCPTVYHVNYYSKPLKDYEFLGYPEIETVAYQKNSTTTVASRNKNYYFQAIETASCFKPSPLKGVKWKSVIYDATNSSNMVENTDRFMVTFGPMFASIGNYTDSNLNSQCPNYNPKATVSTVYSDNHYSKTYVSGTVKLCTRTSTVFSNLNGSADPYLMPHQQINWGRVNCTDMNVDDTSDKAIYNLTDYTVGRNDNKWMLPKPKESWSSDSPSGSKYNHTKYYYDGLGIGMLGDYGSPTKQQKLIDNVVKSETQTFYDPIYTWLPVRAMDPMGNFTITEYDSTLHIYPTKVINPAGQSIKTEYDFNTTDTTLPNKGGIRGVPVKITDVNSQTTEMVYDNFGRLTQNYLPGKVYSSTYKPDTFYKYFYFNESLISSCTEANNCIPGLGKQINNQYGPQVVVMKGQRYETGPTGTTDKYSLTYSYYNGIGQQVQSRNSWSESGTGIPVEGEGLKDLLTSTSYNSYGNDYQSLSYTSAPYNYLSTGGGFDTRNFVSDPAIKEMQNTYDGFGRVSKKSYPDGTSEETIFNFDGDPLKTKIRGKNCTDTNSGTMCSEDMTRKDAFGNVLSTQTIDTVYGKTYSTSFEYDPVLGGVNRTIDTNNNAVSIVEYDKLGRKVKMWDVDMSPSMSGDTNAWRYEYDAAGNLTKQTDPKGQITILAYDSLGRITTSTINGLKVLGNTYDTCINGVGKLCSVTTTDPLSRLDVHSKYVGYDNMGRVVSETVKLSNMPNSTVNPVNFVTTYTYDRGGRMLTQVLPSVSAFGISAETITYNYNKSYLAGITSSFGVQYAKDGKYNKNGQLLSYATGDNVTDSYTYDENNMRLKSLSVANSGKLLDLGYEYDSLGNITKITDKINTAFNDPLSYNQSFSYDPLNRLTFVSGAYSANYTYDSIGNILTKNEGQNNFVTLTYGDYTSGYYHRPLGVDKALSEPTGPFPPIGESYRYDSLGNLTTAGDTTYEYDLANRLIKANVPDSYYQQGVTGDANGDGIVDIADYNIWKTNYHNLQKGQSGPSFGDFDSNGQADGVDYVLWRINSR